MASVHRSLFWPRSIPPSILGVKPLYHGRDEDEDKGCSESGRDQHYFVSQSHTVAMGTGVSCYKVPDLSFAVSLIVNRKSLLRLSGPRLKHDLLRGAGS